MVELRTTSGVGNSSATEAVSRLSWGGCSMRRTWGTRRSIFPAASRRAVNRDMAVGSIIFTANTPPSVNNSTPDYRRCSGKCRVRREVIKILNFHSTAIITCTGLKAPKSENGDLAVELFANDFYQKCLDHKLRPADFDFTEDGTINMKSDVLPTVISKNLQASLIFLYFYHFTLAACVFLLFPRAGNRYAVTAFKHLFSLLPRGKAGKRR